MDGPPPLENASDVVRQIKSKQKKAQETAASMKTTNSTLLQAENQEFVPSLIVDNLKRQEKPAQDSQKTAVNKQPPKKNDSGGFAGFKSGFLMSSTSKKKKQQSKPEFIKPKKQEKADNPLVMNDVQEAMKEEFGSEEFLNSYGKRKLRRENDTPLSQIKKRSSSSKWQIRNLQKQLTLWERTQREPKSTTWTTIENGSKKSLSSFSEKI